MNGCDDYGDNCGPIFQKLVKLNDRLNDYSLTAVPTGFGIKHWLDGRHGNGTVSYITAVHTVPTKESQNVKLDPLLR